MYVIRGDVVRFIYKKGASQARSSYIQGRGVPPPSVFSALASTGHLTALAASSRRRLVDSKWYGTASVWCVFISFSVGRFSAKTSFDSVCRCSSSSRRRLIFDSKWHGTASVWCVQCSFLFSVGRFPDQPAKSSNGFF